MRITLHDDPYRPGDVSKGWLQRGMWRCKWVSCAGADKPPFLTAYRLLFSVENSVTVRFHVSADERYELLLDGRRIGRGPERGDPVNWFFETYDVEFVPGAHVLMARVWSLGRMAPMAQMSVRPGFLLSPQEREWVERIGTGEAPWEAKFLPGYTFIDPLSAWGTGANVVVDGRKRDWGVEAGEGEQWQPVLAGETASNASRNDCPPTHLLRPAQLPPMAESVYRGGAVRLVSSPAKTETWDVPVREADNLPDEVLHWQRLLLGGGGVSVPAQCIRRALIDLDDYLCAYPSVTVSGGKDATVRVHWQEALYTDLRAGTKDNRNETEGKFFGAIWHLKDGVGDTFIADGGLGRVFDTLWWQCGRYVEIVIQTFDEPLRFDRLEFLETRYPLEMESRFRASENRLEDITPIMVRALQMCSHETYMDCPYYEQLMYAGDTRLEALATYVTTRDARLPRKALRMFAVSRLTSNLTQSRYPSRLTQVIPPFSLWWIAMAHDYAMWRGDLEFVRSLMPVARGVIEYYIACVNESGLVEAPDGWNFMDWVPAWDGGMPPSAHEGISGLVNWHFIYTLNLLAELEDMLDERELATRARRLIRELTPRSVAAFWDHRRGMFADDLTFEHFSEHTQCLALLSGQLDSVQAQQVGQSLLNEPELTRATIYFTHYLFEAAYKLGAPDLFADRMELWFGLKEMGFKTTVEAPEPSRSDCHAWGAHPLYHYFASVLGIRPASPGFGSVRIAPRLGTLAWARGTLVHPDGEIVVALEANGVGVKGLVSLPEGVTGTFHHSGKKTALSPGDNQIW